MEGEDPPIEPTNEDLPKKVYKTVCDENGFVCSQMKPMHDREYLVTLSIMYCTTHLIYFLQTSRIGGLAASSDHICSSDTPPPSSTTERIPPSSQQKPPSWISNPSTFLSTRRKQNSPHYLTTPTPLPTPSHGTRAVTPQTQHTTATQVQFPIKFSSISHVVLPVLYVLVGWLPYYHSENRCMYNHSLHYTCDWEQGRNYYSLD